MSPLIPRPVRRSTADGDAILVRAVADGTLDIALRPIVSLARGTAVAFDAFAELGGDGEPFHLARLPAGTPARDRARFEAMLLSRAVDSTRRVMAGATDAPLHVPISRALFETMGEAALLIERLRAHPEASRAIVLDVPAGDLAVSATIPEVLDAFIDAGVRLCLDLTDVRAPDFLGIRRSGARLVRLPAQLLLGHATPRGQGPSGPDIAAAARDAGIEVIADNVATDDDALSLVDFGIDLMSGPRFAPPRRLRDAAAPHPGRAAAE